MSANAGIQPHNERPATVRSTGGASYDQISRGIADSIEHWPITARRVRKYWVHPLPTVRQLDFRYRHNVKEGSPKGRTSVLGLCREWAAVPGQYTVTLNEGGVPQ